MSPPITTIVLHVLNVSIGVLSVVVLGLVAQSVIYTDSLGDVLPQDAKGTGRALLFWPGVGGIVDALLFAFLWFMTPSHGGLTKKRKAYWGGLIFVASFIFGRPFIVLIYTFVEWNQASKSQTSPSHSFITPESWACAAGEEGNANSMCTQLHAARYILIPEIILGATMLALVIWMRIRLSKDQEPVAVGRAQDTKV